MSPLIGLAYTQKDPLWFVVSMVTVKFYSGGGHMALFEYKDYLSSFRDSHYKATAVMRPPYFCDENFCFGKMASLYWKSL